MQRGSLIGYAILGVSFLYFGLSVGALLASIPKVGTGPRPGVIVIEPWEGAPPDSVQVLKQEPKGEPYVLARLILSSPVRLLGPVGGGRQFKLAKSYDAPADTCAVWNVSKDGTLYVGFVDYTRAPRWKGRYLFRAFWGKRSDTREELGK